MMSSSARILATLEGDLREGYVAFGRDTMSQEPNTNDVHVNAIHANDASGDEKSKGLSRRDFLKYSAGTVGATGISGLLAACAANGFGGGGSSGGGGAVTLNFWDMA